MKETTDDKRYRMQMEEKARREGMEAESKRKNDEYNAALESGDVSPEVEAELTRSQAEKDMDDSMRKAVPLNVGGMPNDPMKVKYNEGSMLVAPEMGMEDEMPVDTYDNISEDEKEAAEASQLPDDEMEEDYTGYVLEQSLDVGEQEYLMGVLEGDERLSGIFDKVMDVAGEFSGEGEVSGLGTGVSDSIPARLSDGEFVFTKKATDQMGADQLQTMMDEAEKAFDGGYMMKKAFGGLTSDDAPEIEEEEEAALVRSRMVNADRMPSTNKG